MSIQAGDASEVRRAVDADRGYTIVEVMVVIAVTVIGFMALIHLQTSVLRANENSWNAAGAVSLARHLQETIRLEALEWTGDTYDGTGGVAQAKFRYLKHVGPPATGEGSGWRDAEFYPVGTAFTLVNQLGFQPAYDAGALQALRGDRNQRYCARYRLTWIVPNYLIRADVRILWVRHEGLAGAYDACPGPEGPDSMERHPEDVFTVTFPMTVMRNVFVTP